MAKLSLKDALNTSLTRTKQYIDTELAKKANSSHGTHLTLGTGSGNAFRGDYGNTAYQHSQSAHAPSNAQKNSDITKAEIEAKLTGNITTHTHSYLPLSGGNITGDLKLYASGSNDSPSLIFYRGSDSDSYTDWRVQDRGGSLYFDIRTGSTTFTNKMTFNESGTISATSFTEGGTALADKYAAKSHGTHLTLGTTSSTAYRGDYGNTAYNHSQAAHAPSNAQKNSDITKAEIEAKLTGTITSHNHSGTYAPASHNHTSLTGITGLAFATEGSDSGSISTTVDGTNTYFDFNLADDATQNDMWRWRFTPSGGTLFNAMTLDASSLTDAKLTVTGNVTATSFTENGTALSSKYAAKSHGTHLTIGTGASNAAAGNHTHNYAGSSSAGGAATSANKVNTNLTIKLNSGSTEGTNLFTFNGSAAKTINITPSSIGAAASTHGTHLSLGTTSSTAYRGDYGNTAYNHSQSAHAPSNAQKNSDITKTEIENKLTGTISSHIHDYITSMDTRNANSAPNTYTTRGIYPEFKSTSTVGLPNSGKNFAGVITYQQWGDTTSWSGGKATQFATLDDGRMYFRKGEGTSWGAWNRFYTNLHKPDLEELGAAPASHGTHLTIGTGAGNAAAGNHTHSNYVPSTYLTATASELKYSGDNYSNKGSKVNLGYNNTVSGAISAAIGDQNVVDGNEGVAIGRNNKVHGYGSLVIGDLNEIYSGYVFAIGENNKVGTTTNDNASNLVVIGTGNNLTGSGINNNIIIGNYANCTGSYGNAIGSYAECHNGGNSLGYGCEGWDKGTALGRYSKAFGYYSICGGYYADTGGENSNGEPNRDLGYCGVAFGYSPKAIANNTVALGYCAEAQSNGSYAMGYEAITTGLYSTALGGYYSKAKASYALASGYYAEANGAYSSVFGVGTTTSSYGENMFVIGHYNDTNWSGSSSGTNGAAFTVGNGTGNYGNAETRSNACVISYAGQVMGKAAYSTSGADYAEYFEWIDGNPDAEDRVGYFVTLDGNKIRKAKSGEYLLGIVSGHPAVLGNHDLNWHGQYLTDEFNRPIKKVYKDIVEVKETKSFKDIEISEEEFEKLSYDERKKLLDVTVEKEVEYESFAVNPDYDPNKEYISRADRPEWDAIGMLGVLSVYDDGTCEVNGFCKCDDNGKATACERGFDTYRVIERVNENIIKIIFK